MGDWTIPDSVYWGGSVGGGVAITSGTPAHTKGNYAQLTASSSFTIDALVIHPDYSSGREQMFDIAIGAAGSEKIIVANALASGGGAMTYNVGPMCIPIHIPSGTRIAARSQSTAAADTMYLSIGCYRSNHLRNTLGNYVTTYGANTADSGGTSIDAGSSAYTKGSWVEITSSTTVNHRGLIIGVGNQQNTARTSAAFWVDVGIGAAGSETILLAHYMFGVGGNGTALNPVYSRYFDVSITAGTKLSCRCSSSTTDATDRKIDIVLYCI
jgi:hypothetical protein